MAYEGLLAFTCRGRGGDNSSGRGTAGLWEGLHLGYWGGLMGATGGTEPPALCSLLSKPGLGGETQG